jgi:hypothetical protein
MSGYYVSSQSEQERAAELARTEANYNQAMKGIRMSVHENEAKQREEEQAKREAQGKAALAEWMKQPGWKGLPNGAPKGGVRSRRNKKTAGRRRRRGRKAGTRKH